MGITRQGDQWSEHNRKFAADHKKGNFGSFNTYDLKPGVRFQFVEQGGTYVKYEGHTWEVVESSPGFYNDIHVVMRDVETGDVYETDLMPSHPVREASVKTSEVDQEELDEVNSYAECLKCGAGYTDVEAPEKCSDCGGEIKVYKSAAVKTASRKCQDLTWDGPCQNDATWKALVYPADTVSPDIETEDGLIVDYYCDEHVPSEDEFDGQDVDHVEKIGAVKTASGDKPENWLNLADELNDYDTDSTLDDFDEHFVEDAKAEAEKFDLPWPPGVGDFDNYVNDHYLSSAKTASDWPAGVRDQFGECVWCGEQADDDGPGDVYVFGDRGSFHMPCMLSYRESLGESVPESEWDRLDTSSSKTADALPPGFSIEQYGDEYAVHFPNGDVRDGFTSPPSVVIGGYPGYATLTIDGMLEGEYTPEEWAELGLEWPSGLDTEYPGP